MQAHPPRIRPSGLTLLELMVTLAIVGVLAAVAIPSYARYRNKARQVEARVFLSGIYVAEQAHRIEHDSYTTCLTRIGFEPQNTFRIAGRPYHPSYYTVGFEPACWAGNNTCGRAGNGDCQLLSWNPDILCNSGFGGGFILGQRVANPSMNPLTLVVGMGPGPACVISNAQFRVKAYASISSTSALWDTWSMDETKTLSNAVSGL